MDATKTLYLTNLGGKFFYQNYRKIFKPDDSAIRPLRKANGILETTETEMAYLKQRFFEGHLQEQDFYQHHFAAFTVRVKDLGIRMDSVHHLDREFMMLELEKKNQASTFGRFRHITFINHVQTFCSQNEAKSAKSFN